MRKFLSLVLALVMMMSLVTINAGAKEFTDGDDITYQEAVDVISTIKVVDGYAGGDFKPGNNLTRGAAAKIICNMILGPTTAAELHADTAPYRDVPVTSDFAGYIAYCQKEGIISGYADGSFRPAGTLTGYAFMKMLLGALGYDAEVEGYTGPNWSINVAKKAIGLGLNQSLEKTFNGVDFVTREEAALYAFNTLKADLVEYSSKITANVNGAEVAIGNSNAEPQKWESQKTRSDNIYKDGLVQFAEQYFNKLVLTEDMDVFGRPDREWRYDGDDIGAYINMDLFKQEYTTKVTGRDLYDLLGSRTVDEYNFEIRVDGIETVTENKSDLGSAYFTEANMIRSNTEKVGETGNGVLTQVFVDNDKEVEKVYIAVINTYLAKATADYNEKKDEADYEVWSLDNKNTDTDPVLVKDARSQSAKLDKETLTVSGEDFDIENVKENDIVLVRVADGAIQEILDPEVIDEAEIVSFKKDNWVKADEQYDYATTAMYDDEVLDEYDLSNMKDTTYRIFLDPYGYAIGVEIIEDAAKYVFLTGIDGNTSNLRNKTADGNLIFTDGTMKTAKINMEKSKALNTAFVKGTDTAYTEFVPGALWNTWCTYSVNSDGVYTLTQVANTDEQMETDDAGKVRTGKRTTDKVGQGRNITPVAGDTDYTAIIDKKHISLDGLNDHDGSDTSTLYRKVYGNDDSVYINVGVSRINNATTVYPYNDRLTGTNAVIIDDIDSVTTGVQSVSLKAYDWNKVKTLDAKFTDGSLRDENYYAYGAYTLFDSDGFVIAAVVVGEDDGVSSKYAYTFSDSVDQEDWSKADKEWTWTKDVIIDGEEVTLTEKGDSLSELKTMRMNNWYEVKFKADETVKSVTLIDPADAVNHGDYVFCKNPEAVNHPAGDSAGRGTYPKFVGKIELVEGAQEDNTSGKVILFEDMYTGNTDGNNLQYTLDTAGTSLQVKNATGGTVKGFAVSGNAKTVLVQDKRVINKDGQPISEMDSIEYFDGGRSGLERAVKKLNLNNKVTDEWFRGYVSAVFENGVAQTVIIYEKLPNDVNWGGDSSGNNGGFKWLDTSNINAPTYMGPAPSDADIYDLLRSLGYTDISKNGSQWSYTAPNGLSYSGVTITPQGKVEVKINGQTLTVNEGTFTPSANLGTGVSYSAATHGTYAKATYADGTTDHVDMTAADNLTQNVSYEIGYYKINVASSVTANSLSNGGGTITAAVDNADNAVFAKKGEAGDTVDMPVELTYGAAVTGGGLKFTANNSATVRGSIPAGAAGTKVVTVEVPTNTLAGNVTVALTAADQAVTINIYVNGTPTTVEVGAKISDIVNDIPDNANAFVLVQELAYGDTAASVDADVATTVKAGNYAIQSSDTNLNIGTVEFTKYTPNTVNVNGTALTASTAVTDGEVYTTGGQDYITVGASVKTTLTATADIVAPDTWATYTTKMVVASATATDTVAYTGSVAGWAASATQTLTNNTPFTTGTASTIVAEDDTFVITHDGVAASVTTFAPGNVTVTAPAEN